MEGMSEKMNKKPAAPTLPVSVDNNKKLQQPRAARCPFLHSDVQLVNLWMLYNAVAITISFAVSVACDYDTLTVDPAAALLPSAATKQTDAEGTLLVMGILWCSTPQALAAALALLLPCHRWRLRRAAAYAAFAFTVASQSMLAAAVLLAVRADPEDLFFTIMGAASIFICVVGDLLGFLALLRFRGGED